MRASHSFFATMKDVPQEAQIVSHRLMLRTCMIQQIASGIYAWLPMGLRVLRKIEEIVRQEQNRAGAVEMLAPTLQPSDLWKQSGRYADYGKELLRMEDRHGRELFYGPTAEELFTEVFRTHIKSYKDLPQRLYNIQWKFRDEIRPRFGVMRGREFLMKDTYSFDLTQEGAHDSYKAMFTSYMRTFRRMGLTPIPVRASTGPIGGDLSHEFQIVAKTGESKIYYDTDLTQGKKETLEEFASFYAMADDKHNPETCPVPADQLHCVNGIEVGHIFYFGTKYSMALNAYIANQEGQRIPAEMGSYGIGVSRLVGAIIEAFHDEKGIQWPVSVAPFTVAIAAVGKREQTKPIAAHFFQTFLEQGIDAFFYDLDKTTGHIFSDLDLIGFPYQVIIGDQWLENKCLEIKNRATQERHILSEQEAYIFLSKALAPNFL